jgi:hypothetical protein
LRLAVLAACLVHLACQASPPAAPVPDGTVGVATVEVERYDLERDEDRGGHTLARHVSRSDAELRDRLNRQRDISAASAYTDRATAERVVEAAIAQNRRRVDQWLARHGPRPNLALDYHGAPGDVIGRSLTRRGRQAVACTDAVVVLRSDGRDGFYVLTSYPERSR